MAESRSWAIIQALADRLADIRVADGYLTNIGTAVWTIDAQRPSEDALGLMIYSESITGPGIDRERPGKPVRDFSLVIEAAISTTLDDAQQRIHAVIDDVDRCLAAYARDPRAWPAGVSAMQVGDIAILDRPEGAAVVAMQAHVTTRYFR